MKKGFYCNIECVHNEVTGSCIRVTVHYLDGKVTTFLVDCGVFQEQKYKYFNPQFPFDPSEIDFVLVTHAHADHIGRIPMLVKNGFDKGIYCTDTSLKIMKFALDDTYHVLKDDAERNGTKLLFHHSDVDDALSLMSPKKYGKYFEIEEIEDKNIRAYFIMNGHLEGAAMILVNIRHYSCKEEINLLFTGDYKPTNMFFDVPEIGNKLRTKNVTIISESTYGDTESSSLKRVFRKNVEKWVDNGGTVYLPVFALGRCQEILYTIINMKESGIIDPDIPVFLDGTLAGHYCNLFRKDKLNNDVKMMMKLDPKYYTMVTASERTNIMEDGDQKIVLFTSGMCSYGPAKQWIPYGYRRKEVLIHLTGYPAEDTLAEALYKTTIGQKASIYGSKIQKKCTVMCTNEFSGHGKADDLIRLYKKFDNVNSIILNHGSVENKQLQMNRILEETDITKVGVLGTNGYRVNAYGIDSEIENTLLCH